MVLLVNIDDNEKWDNTVKGFENFDVYYLSGYVKASMPMVTGSLNCFFMKIAILKQLMFL